LTNGLWLMTRDTVFFDTSASRATSLIVGLRRGSAAGGGTAFVACAGFIVFFMSHACARASQPVKRDNKTERKDRKTPLRRRHQATTRLVSLSIVAKWPP
jgi:hypothetical protein